jgi:hypothetical protein
MTKALRKSLDKVLKNYIYEFEKKQEVEFTFAVADDLMGVICMGDYSLSMSDIAYDIDNDVAKGVIFNWYNDGLEACSKGIGLINYHSYVRGLRYKDLKA